jgi:DNA-binding Lrp family transcriptional regulator
MDHIDKIILNHIQKDFPVTSRPYLEIASQIGITEQEVIERIKTLKESGVIRRLGGIFDSRKLGYVSTLCAIKVPEDRINEVADLINSYLGVTHNYLRNHDYNMWFTCIAPSAERIDDILIEIKRKTGLEDLINLPSINFFKIKVDFSLKEDC